ncbi:MAG: hypothetical protein GY832_02090, partial [Chloroflexi bacterium]|nr:hypothetical protein [Chloroflexota bacterium]
KYYFAVRALDSSENRGGVSNNVWGRTIDAIPPSTIINLKADPYNPTNALPMKLTVDDASGEYSSTTAAELLLDHNSETIWLSPQRDEIVPEYVEFDLGGTKVLGKMRLLAAPTFEDLFPVDFTIELKESYESDWKPVISETFFGTDGDWEEWVMGAVTAVKARILITNTAKWSDSYFTALSEFELYENPNQFDTVLLSWNAPGGDGSTGQAASYDLRRADDPIADDTLFEGALVLPDVQKPAPASLLGRYMLGGLQPQTQYCFAIKSADDVGNLSGLSNSPCVTTMGEPPSTIIDLEVVDATTDSLSITWTAPGEDGANGQAERYVIKYSKERINTINWNAATSVEEPPQPSPSGTLESYTIENLEGSTKYYIAVRAIDSGENISAISNNAIGETLDNVPPSVITDLAAETNYDAWGSLHVNWTAPGGNGPVGTASDYDLRISKNEITEENFYQSERLLTPFPNPSGTPEFITIYDREPEAFFYLAIKSLDNAENTSDLSNNTSARTRDENPGDIIDLAIIGSTGTVTDNGTITIQWTAPGDDAYIGTAHHYDIRYSPTRITEGTFTSATKAADPILPLEAGTVQQFTIDGLKLEKTYYFAIKTTDERDNESGISNIPSGSTEDEVPPSQVIDLVATTGKVRGAVDLTWTEPGDDEMTGRVDLYDIRWSYEPITPENFEAATPSSTSLRGGVGGTTRKFTMVGLPDEMKLHFALKTIDNAENISPMSNDAPGRTPDVPPGKITDMAQEAATLTSITISWTATGDDHYEGTATETDLRVSEAPITEDNFADATRVLTDPPQISGTTQASTAKGLKANTQYYFAIKAVDDRGNWSPLSVLTNCQTVDDIPPGQINPLNAETHPLAGMINLTWTATGDDGDVGTATTYELRCSTSTITEENFEQATLISGLHNPKRSGVPESFTVIELLGETLFHCAIRAIDEVGNKGPISPNSSCETQPIPPDPIDDLAGTAVKPRSVILTWTAPGDDGMEGTATSYDIRYSETKITTYNFSYCQKAPVIPTPLPAGTPQTTTVPGLKESTLYYFAIKTTDDKGAVSALSNVAEVITLDETAPCAPDPVKVYSSEGYGWTGGYVLDPDGASASTQLADSLGPDKTLDKDQQTMWVSHGIEFPRPENLTIDIGYETNVDKIRLLANIEYIHLFPQNFTVSVSVDNENWTEIHRVEKFDSPTETWMTWAFYPRRARYVRVTAYDTMISYFGLFWTVIADMEVYKARSLCGGTWLAWEAPGDDCYVGTVTYYDIFYSLSPFDNYTLHTAVRIGMPSDFEPGPAGTWEGRAIGGLKGETRYYFAVRAVDEAGNVGPISEVVTTTTPKTPPAPVDDLETIDIGLYEATLEWTATGDDGRVGTATSYEMRYAPWSITEENFHLATEVPDMPVPEPS